LLEANSITIGHIPTEKNIADLFIKDLPRTKHHNLIEMIGLTKLSKSVESNNLIKTVNLTIKSKSDSSIILKPHKTKLNVKEKLNLTIDTLQIRGLCLNEIIFSVLLKV
jgi:hypothetical protein